MNDWHDKIQIIINKRSPHIKGGMSWHGVIVEGSGPWTGPNFIGTYIDTGAVAGAPGIGGGTLTPDAFNQMITDASAFSLTLDSGTRNAIQWIAAKDSILIGTTGGEWSLGGHTRDKPITALPGGYSIRQHTAHGSKDLQPILLTDGFAFVNYVGRKLLKLDYDGLDEEYTATELSLLAEHITKSGIVDMAFQRNPDPILWLVREDGVLLSMTYDPKQDVVAWARHPMESGGTETVSELRPIVNTDYPRLRTTTDQDDLQLPHVTAIANVEQLQEMNNDKTGNYYLTNDIDASDTLTWNSGQGFKPIAAGDGVQYFTGTFDGCGYTISNLFINWGQTAWTENGLFGGIRDTAKIANVTLTDVSVTGNRSDTGGLVGYFSVLATGGSEPIIQNCHTSGTVTTTDTAAGYSYIGGLIGLAQGNNDPLSAKVYDCSSSCTVTALDNLATTVTNVGGLIGGAKQTIVSNCSATGLVTGGTKSRYVGGLIGFTSDASGSVTGCDISYCYATGTVSGQSEVGGLIGSYGNALDIGTCVKSYATGNVTAGTTTPGGASSVYLGGLIGFSTGDIVDCYAWDDVTSASTDSIAGGLVGDQITTGVGTKTEITNCYCIGAVSGVDATGGFTADGGDADTTSCYWDTEASGNATSDTGTGKTTTQMKTESTYTDWDFDTIWYMLPLIQETVLSSRAESVAVIPSTTEDEVWLTVSRVIDDVLVRYIERMKSRDWGDDMEDMFFIDSGLTYDGDPTTSITGLDHLEGETVAILADGAVQPSKTVSGGAITLTDAALVVQVGLPFTYKLKPMRMDQNTQSGTSKGSVKTITEAVISFYKTLNARYGDGTDTLDIDWRETSAEYTTPPDLVTGDKVVVADGGFSVEDPFQIEGNSPMPCSVRAIIPRIDQTGR